MRNLFKTSRLATLLAVMTLLMSPFVNAQEENPFAEHKFVLQISDMDPSKQTLVLNVASNIIKHYGPDKADVEIVAFGPGLRLLFGENSNAGRIDGLTQSGVRFAACQNTINKMSSTLGRDLVLNKNAKVVPGGIVRIKELVDQDFTLVKP